MFKKIKQMATKIAVQRQIKNLPKQAQDQILALIETHPDFFEKMAREIKERVDRGEDQMVASQAVAMKHQKELMQLMMSTKKK